ncbi:unnamed protein product [Trichogramma brassicae]|uniref:Reverse transcriptase zinc-binding domain-containing protein n=1 Tax=Trichogramma brassicae TaxID=86971 RepID=A0A6H5IA05_9HYME|nr:unnamed protein product [Trichogramma brassicae]
MFHSLYKMKLKRKKCIHPDHTPEKTDVTIPDERSAEALLPSIPKEVPLPESRIVLIFFMTSVLRTKIHLHKMVRETNRPNACGGTKVKIQFGSTKEIVILISSSRPSVASYDPRAAPNSLVFSRLSPRQLHSARRTESGTVVSSNIIEQSCVESKHGVIHFLYLTPTQETNAYRVESLNSVGCATETQAYIRQAEAVHRRACLRVISGRPHVSYDATYVIASVPPLALLADERACIYQRRPEDVKEEERRETLSKWQDWWDRASNGRWTHHLIPNITEWVERGHGALDYYLTQLLSGPGNFQSHSQRYDDTLSALCPACSTTIEDAEHTFFHCPQFHEERERLQQVLQEVIEPENIVRLMLETAGNWMAGIVFHAISRFQTEARGARDIITIRTMLQGEDDASGSRTPNHRKVDGGCTEKT